MAASSRGLMSRLVSSYEEALAPVSNPSGRQVRCLVDVQGDKLPSASSGALQAHLETVVAPQVCLSLAGPEGCTSPAYPQMQMCVLVRGAAEPAAPAGCILVVGLLGCTLCLDEASLNDAEPSWSRRTAQCARCSAE